MPRSTREVLLRLLLLLAGLAVAHLGVTLFLLADLGSDPFNVLVQGGARSLRDMTGSDALTHGRVHIAANVAIIAVLLSIDRPRVKLGTFVCMAAGGPIIDLFTSILAPALGGLDSLPLRVLLLIIGCVILAYGMTLVISSDAGTGPNDLVAVVAAARSGFPFGPVRVVTDCLFVLTGFLLGGTLGVGTLICMFLVGPVAGFFLPLNGRLVAGICARVLARPSGVGPEDPV